MNVWQSPVLYFGLFLVMVISMAMAAPYVTDWNAYKPGLESFGSRLTGRDVTINGDIEIRLFPVPRLIAADVKVSNPAGMEGAPLLEVRSVQLELALGSLLNGELDVQSVEIEEPRIALLRETDGRVNWMIGPAQRAQGSTLLSKVRLDSIKVLNGEVKFEDRRKGFRSQLNTIDLDMSAAKLEGPWRLRGTGFLQNTLLNLSFNSSSIEDNGPFRFGLRVQPQDTAFPSVSFDGSWNGSTVDGDLNVDPQVQTEEKIIAEGGLKPIRFQSTVSATADTAAFEKIRVTPSDVRDSGTLIEGRANLDMTGDITALLELNAPRVNLDTLLGVEGMTTLREGGMKALASEIMRRMPERLGASVVLNLGVLTYGGETLQNLGLKASAAKGKITITELRTGLPGRSGMIFAGDVRLQDGEPEVDGRLDFESSDVRAFMRWLLPERAKTIDEYWKGSRGRLKMIAGLGWSPALMRLSNTEFEFDGEPGKVNFSLSQGTPGALDLRLDIRALNSDDLMPGAFASKGASAFDVLGLLTPLLTDSNQMEKRISIATDTLTLNGQQAQNVALEFESGAKGIEVKKLAIGSVGGATLTADGLVINGQDGPSGEFVASLVAADPSGFLQLVGLAGPSSRWVEGLGETEAKVDLAVKPSPSGPIVNYAFKGKTGPQRFDLSGEITDLEKAADARLTASGKLAADEALQLLRVYGLQPRINLAGPGETTFNIDGSRSEGFAVRFEGDVAQSKITFDGRLKPGAPYGGATGTVSLVAPQAQPVLAVLGIPTSQAEGNIQATARLVTEGETLKVGQLFGNLGPTSFQGEIAIDATGKLSGDVETGDMTLTALLGPALLPWDGREASLASGFALPEDMPFVGEFSVRPARLLMPAGPAIAEAAVVFTLAETRKISVLAPTRPDVGLSLSLTPSDNGYEVELSGSTVIEVAKLFALENGTVVAGGEATVKGSFRSEGRTPASVLSALTGEGTLTMTDGVLNRLSPQALSNGIGDAKSAQELQLALQALEAEGQLPLGEVNGTLTADKGTLSLSPILLDGVAEMTSVEVLVDLAAGELAARATITLKGRPDLPGVTVGYAGPPGLMLRRASTAALAAKLGHDLLARDLEELERLRQEQEKIAVEEQTRRDADVAKFEAYQAQRAELRLRNRELKTHQVLRVRRQELEAKAFDEFVTVADSMNKNDLAKAKLHLAVVRNLALFEERRIEAAKTADAERQKAEEERLRKLEAERVEAEETQRAAAEAARVERERKAREEEERAERERLAKEEAEKLKQEGGSNVGPPPQQPSPLAPEL